MSETSSIRVSAGFVKTCAEEGLNRVTNIREQLLNKKLENLTKRKWYRPWKYGERRAKELLTAELWPLSNYDHIYRGWRTESHLENLLNLANNSHDGYVTISSEDAFYLKKSDSWKTE